MKNDATQPKTPPLTEAERLKMIGERRREAIELLGTSDADALAAQSLILGGTHRLAQVSTYCNVKIGDDDEITVTPFLVDGREVVSSYRVWKVPKRERPRCGARCRDGHLCVAPVTLGTNGDFGPRCRMHGGNSPWARKSYDEWFDEPETKTDEALSITEAATSPGVAKPSAVKSASKKTAKPSPEKMIAKSASKPRTAPESAQAKLEFEMGALWRASVEIVKRKRAGHKVTSADFDVLMAACREVEKVQPTQLTDEQKQRLRPIIEAIVA